MKYRICEKPNKLFRLCKLDSRDLWGKSLPQTTNALKPTQVIETAMKQRNCKSIPLPINVAQVAVTLLSFQRDVNTRHAAVAVVTDRV